MRVLRLFLNVLFSPLLWLVYALSFVVPRSSRIWVFGSYKNGFNDNSKYMFLETSINDPEIFAVWITGNDEVIDDIRTRGFRVCRRFSFMGVWYALRAQVYVYSAYLSDINFWFSGGAAKINLWHGVPLKKIAYDIDAGPRKQRHHGNILRRLPYLILTPYFFSKPTYVLSPSAYLEKILVSALGMHAARILRAKYPRIDMLTLEEAPPGTYSNVLNNERERATAMAPISFGESNTKYVLYAPTWRDNSRNFIAETPIDWRRLDGRLAEIDAKLLIKLHPNSSCDAEFFAGYANMYLLDNNVDIYPLLPRFDCLITDYSSIYFDFLFLDKDIIFFPYDMDSYVTSGRSMYADYFEITPGRKVFDSEGLLDAISECTGHRDAGMRIRIRNMVWGDTTMSARNQLKILMKHWPKKIAARIDGLIDM